MPHHVPTLRTAYGFPSIDKHVHASADALFRHWLGPLAGLTDVHIHAAS